MSADKQRGRTRRLLLLKMASANEHGRLMLNHEGGMAFDDADLQESIRRGYFNVNRRMYDGFSTYGRAREMKMGSAPRTFAEITDAGRQELIDGENILRLYKESTRQE